MLKVESWVCLHPVFFVNNDKTTIVIPNLIGRTKSFNYPSEADILTNFWIPAFAGMTTNLFVFAHGFLFI